MLYRPFRDSGIQTSLMGLGCMRFPTTGETEEIHEKKAEAIIDSVYAAGVNYFVTAYVYNRGDSERVTGKALSKYPRERFYLATKLPGWQCRSERDVCAIVERQLAWCGLL